MPKIYILKIYDSIDESNDIEFETFVDLKKKSFLYFILYT